MLSQPPIHCQTRRQHARRLLVFPLGWRSLGWRVLGGRGSCRAAFHLTGHVLGRHSLGWRSLGWRGSCRAAFYLAGYVLGWRSLGWRGSCRAATRIGRRLNGSFALPIHHANSWISPWNGHSPGSATSPCRTGLCRTYSHFSL